MNEWMNEWSNKKKQFFPSTKFELIEQCIIDTTAGTQLPWADTDV